MHKRLFLLDAFALIYRAYFAFSRQPLYNSKGNNTSAAYGFTLTLMDLLEGEQPSHVAVCFDTEAPTERDQLFEAYKAQRQQQPEDITRMLPYIRQIIEALRIPILELDGYEADDIMGTLAKQAASKQYHVYLVTADKDLGQLVDERISIYRPVYRGNGFEVLGPDEIKTRWQINNPLQLIDILALMGDTVDNIPGVPGIGEKTAIKLIQQYGSVEGVLEHIDDLKGKVREQLVLFKEQALLSKQLATIVTDVPVPFDEQKLIRAAPDRHQLAQLFAELEFRTLGKRILGEGFSVLAPSAIQTTLFGNETVQGQPPKIHGVQSVYNTPHDYQTASDEQQIRQLCTWLLQQKEFCFDTESTHPNVHQAELVGIAFSWQKGLGWYVPVPPDRRQAKAILEMLQPALAHPGICKIGQNLKYDLLLLKWYDVPVVGPFFDTMLAHFLLDPDSRHNMDRLAEDYLKYRPIPIEELIGKRGKTQGNMRDVAVEKVTEYACEDADVTWQLKQIFAAKLAEQNLESLFWNVEMPLMPVLAEMEFQGVRIDSEFLRNYSIRLEQEMHQTEQKIYEYAGEKFNIASPRQLAAILYERLRITTEVRKTKSGQYSTDEETLRSLMGKHPIIEHLIDYRELAKLKSTYVDALPAMINHKTKRVHTSYNQAIAATGRLSSVDPNLQNIPIRTERGREIRKAFVPRDDDHILLSCDYSQIELRIIAALSHDEQMMAFFRQGLDIHAATAAQIFGVDLAAVTPEMRRQAKAVNFGIAYGQTAFGLANSLGITRSEAQQIIANYQQQFPGVVRLMQEQIAFARAHGYVQTILGRRRYVRDIHSANQTVRAQAERLAINSPIQGSAADIIKVAMIRIHETLKNQFPDSHMIMQVHDELVFDVHHRDLEQLIPLVEECMKHAVSLPVALEVSRGVGRNWYDAH